MRHRQSILRATFAAFALTMSGCGGGSSSTPPPPPAVTVTLSGQPASLTTSATASITATVSNGVGVTWSATCATSPCGTFSSATTASGVATTYTAPATPTSVTITATTSSGTAAAASATISITAPTVTVTLSGQPASLTTSATASITATVSNGVGVTWSATCATSPCGTFSSATTASGVATTYTAPATPTSVTITATTSSGTAAAASATISITAPTVTVTLSGQPTSLTTGATASITATVSNGAGVTWSVTCAASPCGTFSSATTASGVATTYTAPATPTSVTITATTSSGTAASASATITITAPAAITVALNPTPPTSLVVGGTASLTPVVSNDSKNGGVTWSCVPASSCGSFNPTSTASGTATVYTAPATVPNPNTVTITATSVTDTTKSASATVTITLTPILADGNYVYHFSGWDANGPSFFVGAFTVAGGVITGGEQDFSDAANGFPLVALVPANCSLSGAGNNIQVVLGLANNTTIGVNGIETVRGTVVSSSRVLISEFDTFGAATGSIDLQTTPVAAPSGGYAFVTSGWDINNTTSPPTFLPLAIGGVLNFTGTSLTITNSVFDYNVGGQVGQALLFASGSLSGPDPFGRVTISLTPTSTSNVPAFILTGYVIGPNQIRLVESQADTLSDDLGGVALGQGSNAGGFSLSSLGNTTYVFAASGQDVNSASTFGGLATFGGNLSFSTSGALSGTLAINDGTNFVATNITGGNYVVDFTGRSTISGILTSQFPNDAFTFQLYLDGNGNALQLGADALEFTSGPAYLKTATSNDFEGPYALEGSGIINATSLPAWGAVGPVTVSSDTLTGTADYGAQGLTPAPAVTVTAAENSTASTLSVVGLDSSAFTASRLYSYFPIDSKRVFAIEIDGAQLGILALETPSH